MVIIRYFTGNSLVIKNIVKSAATNTAIQMLSGVSSYLYIESQEPYVEEFKFNFYIKFRYPFHYIWISEAGRANHYAKTGGTYCLPHKLPLSQNINDISHCAETDWDCCLFSKNPDCLLCWLVQFYEFLICLDVTWQLSQTNTQYFTLHTVLVSQAHI